LASETGKPMTRRELLRLVAFSAVGAAVVIAGHGLVEASSSKSEAAQSSASPASSGAAAKQTSALSLAAALPAAEVASPASSAPQPSSGTAKVKVMYFQMPLAVDTTEEYFTLPSPATYADLLPLVVGAHPAISPMIPTMMVLVDGLVAQPSTPLRDGDEVDFIPAVAGG
jgi:molybdopterin converting factor small subunit